MQGMFLEILFTEYKTFNLVFMIVAKYLSAWKSKKFPTIFKWQLTKVKSMEHCILAWLLTSKRYKLSYKWGTGIYSSAKMLPVYIRSQNYYTWHASNAWVFSLFARHSEDSAGYMCDRCVYTTASSRCLWQHQVWDCANEHRKEEPYFVGCVRRTGTTTQVIWAATWACIVYHFVFLNNN